MRWNVGYEECVTEFKKSVDGCGLRVWEIQSRGGWRYVGSAQRYVKHGRLDIVVQALTAKVRAAFRRSEAPLPEILTKLFVSKWANRRA